MHHHHDVLDNIKDGTAQAEHILDHLGATDQGRDNDHDHDGAHHHHAPTGFLIQCPADNCIYNYNIVGGPGVLIVLPSNHTH